MADINGALQPTHESFVFKLHPNSLILSDMSNPSDFILQRGSRYKAYAELRESKLRMKQRMQEDEPELMITPPKKRVTFQSIGVGGGGGGIDRTGVSVSSMVARSVPDFSAVLRKENRKPSTILEMTPPLNSKKVAKCGGSRSAGGGDKRGGGGMLGRKSVASIAELKGMGTGVACTLNREGKGGAGGGRKTVLGYRQY